MWKRYDDLYEISDDGHIRNVKTGNVLHEFIRPDGYYRTQLHGKTITVHRKVAEVYIPNPNNYPEINHINGIKTDNRVENLEWCDRSYNLRHAYQLELKVQKGEHNSRNILSENDVRSIRSSYIRGDDEYGTKGLSKKYGVARQTISAIITGQNWSWLS